MAEGQAKGYWIARVDVTNEEAYKAYTLAIMDSLRKFGGRFLVRGGPFEMVEGQARARNVVIEFPDYETALACWHSPEYAAAKALRDGHGTADIVVIGGYEGAQP
jgi:uncharacterized protein (DUF1330 family)